MFHNIVSSMYAVGGSVGVRGRGLCGSIQIDIYYIYYNQNSSNNRSQVANYERSVNVNRIVTITIDILLLVLYINNDSYNNSNNNSI